MVDILETWEICNSNERYDFYFLQLQFFKNHPLILKLSDKSIIAKS